MKRGVQGPVMLAAQHLLPEFAFSAHLDNICKNETHTEGFWGMLASQYTLHLQPEIAFSACLHNRGNYKGKTEIWRVLLQPQIHLPTCLAAWR